MRRRFWWRDNVQRSNVMIFEFNVLKFKVSIKKTNFTRKKLKNLFKSITCGRNYKRWCKRFNPSHHYFIRRLSRIFNVRILHDVYVCSFYYDCD